MNTIPIALQQAINFIPDAVLIVNDRGTMVMVNAQAETMFGYGQNALENQHLNILIPERYHYAHEGHLSNYQAHPSIRNMGEGQMLFGRRNDGSEFDVSIALSPIEIEGKKMVLATVRDVTEKRELQQALEWKNEQLEAINTQLNRFGFTISHDLKSPLANLQGIIHLITRELPESKKTGLSEHIRQLNLTIYSMSELISGVAAYSSATLEEVTKGVEIDMDLLMKEVRVLTLLPSHFTLDVENHLPITWGNKTKLLQVFLNLISNAIKYNDKEEGIIKVLGKLMDDNVYFCIEDNGPGIARELREKVFSIFEKGTSTRRDSQGIGLAIVYKVITDLGGSITIGESVLGGAKFQIELPVMQKKAKADIVTSASSSCPFMQTR